MYTGRCYGKAQHHTVSFLMIIPSYYTTRCIRLVLDASAMFYLDRSLHYRSAALFYNALGEREH